MKHYETIKASITPQMVKAASDTLHEDQKKVSSAASMIMSALLVKFIDRGETPQINDTIREAGHSELYDKRSQIFTGATVDGGMNLGGRLENELIGRDNKNFPAAVAAESGMTTSGAERLTRWVAAALLAYLGDKVVHGNTSMSSLMSDLRSERASIVKDIPVKVARAAGISGACNANTTAAGAAATGKNSKKPDKKNNWWIWLIIAAIVIIIIILSVRSCDRKRTDRDVVATETTMNDRTDRNNRDTRMAQNNQNVQNTSNTSNTNNLTFVQHRLPDGQVIEVAEGGCEDCMMKYLKSNAYKNATNAELSKEWIQFDNIDFKHDSETQLEGNSMQQLDNIAKILKNYPDVKIKIGGLADKTGGKAINYEISKKRADYVKSILVKDGINANRISTEGFGEDLATVPADATDAQRAIDRSIAMRFTK